LAELSRAVIEWIIASKSLGALHVRAGVVARARRASLPHRRGENGKTGGKSRISR
jgi:hypothetical protein